MKALVLGWNSSAPLALILLIFASGQARSDTFIVTTAVDLTVPDADLSLREALELANLNPGADTIAFDASLTGATLSLMDGGLVVSDDTTVNGSDQTIDAVELSRIMAINNSVALHLSNMTLTNGMAGSATDGSSNGGGIFIDSGAVVTLTQVNITQSQGYSGGAIATDGTVQLTINGGEFLNNLATRSGGALYSPEGELTVSGGAIIAGNTAEGAGPTDGGGGIYQGSSGKLVVNENVQIIENLASGTEGSGGGILNLHELEATDIVMRGNSANRAGGGMALKGSYISTLTGVALSSNHAGPASANGGGLHVASQAIVTVTGSTFSGNTATNRGGGFFSGTAGVVNLFSSTVSGNTSSSGGGVFQSGTEGSMAFVSMTIANNTGGGVILEGGTTISRNSIYSDNSGGDCEGVSSMTSAGANLFGSTPTCILSGDVSDIIGVDAQLHALSHNGGSTLTHLPMSTSPVLDSGTCPPETDQRGMARPVDLPGTPNSINGCDIGAVERQVIEDMILADGFDPASSAP